MTPLSFRPDRCKDPATLHAPTGVCRGIHFAIANVLATAPAVFSPGVECWQAHNPSAAPMKRTLAKFTDFMDPIQPAGA
jgi:hypothetical protein